MKKLFAIMLSAVMACAAAVVLSACGEEELSQTPDDGKTYEKTEGSEGLEYTLLSDGSGYALTGLGTCAETKITVASEYDNLPVTQIGLYTTVEEVLENVPISTDEELFELSVFAESQVTSVTIPDGVKIIGVCAFVFSSITQITIPDGVTAIGFGAFAKCASLSSVTIGSSVETIGWGAFSDCTSLESVVIPDNVKIIYVYTFRNCTSLSNVTIGSGVETIEGDAFEGCSSLTSVVFKNPNGWWVYAELWNLTDPEKAAELLRNYRDGALTRS